MADSASEDEVVIPLPHHLLESAAVEGVHNNFINAIKGESGFFDPDRKALIVRSRTAETRALSLQLTDIHLATLKQKAFLSKSLDSAKLIAGAGPDGLCKRVVQIPRDLMGLAIGKEGCNIKLIQASPGIRSIHVDKTYSRITIVGTEAAASEAACRVKVCRESLGFEKKFTSRVIGKAGRNLLGICERNGVDGFRIEESADPASMYTWASFKGKAINVWKARQELELFVADLRKVDQLASEKNRLDLVIEKQNTTSIHARSDVQNNIVEVASAKQTLVVPSTQASVPSSTRASALSSTRASALSSTQASVLSSTQASVLSSTQTSALSSDGAFAGPSTSTRSLSEMTTEDESSVEYIGSSTAGAYDHLEAARQSLNSGNVEKRKKKRGRPPKKTVEGAKRQKRAQNTTHCSTP